MDSWEDNDNSANTPATTPEEEENSISDETYVPASKPRTKVKVEAKEATTTEKEHVNVVFIGHVDAGKSTIGGQIMNLTGMVDKRTLEKYEREAKEKNRETWYLSWCMDTNLEGMHCLSIGNSTNFFMDKTNTEFDLKIRQINLIHNKYLL